jgi:hypothetical protein
LAYTAVDKDKLWPEAPLSWNCTSVAEASFAVIEICPVVVSKLAVTRLLIVESWLMASTIEPIVDDVAE